MIRFFLTVLCFWCYSHSYAQNVIFEVPDGEEIEVELDMEVSESSNQRQSNDKYEMPTIKNGYPVGMPDNIRYNKAYQVEREINSGYDFFRIGSGELYGISRKDGNIVLPPIFKVSFYQDYRDGTIELRLGNMEGLFDLSQEKWVIPFKYHDVDEIEGGLYLVRLYNKTGILTANRQVILDLEYSSVSKVSNQSNYFVLGDEKGKGIYNLITQKFVVPKIYDEISEINYSNLFIVKKDGSRNILDLRNDLQFEKWYTSISSIDDGKYFEVERNGLKGVLDDKENEMIPVKYTYLERSDRYNKLSPFVARNQEGKFGIIKIDGSVLLPFDYDVMDRQNGNNLMSSKGQKCGVIRIDGGTPQEIVTCDYADIEMNYGSFIAQKGNKFGLLSLSGDPLTEFNYDAIKVLENDSKRGLYLGSRKDEMFLLDANGKVLNEGGYEDVRPLPKIDAGSKYYYNSLSFNYLIVLKENASTVNIIDKAGAVITDKSFDDVIGEYNNQLLVKANGKYGVYSLLTRAWVIEAKYDQLIMEESHFMAFDNNKTYMITTNTGKPVVKPIMAAN